MFYTEITVTNAAIFESPIPLCCHSKFVALASVPSL